MPIKQSKLIVHMDDDTILTIEGRHISASIAHDLILLVNVEEASGEKSTHGLRRWSSFSLELREVKDDE